MTEQIRVTNTDGTTSTYTLTPEEAAARAAGQGMWGNNKGEAAPGDQQTYKIEGKTVTESELVLAAEKRWQTHLGESPLLSQSLQNAVKNLAPDQAQLLRLLAQMAFFSGPLVEGADAELSTTCRVAIDKIHVQIAQIIKQTQQAGTESTYTLTPEEAAARAAGQGMWGNNKGEAAPEERIEDPTK